MRGCSVLQNHILVISSMEKKTQVAEVKDLEADNCKSMDDDTRNALGSLFDDED